MIKIVTICTILFVQIRICQAQTETKISKLNDSSSFRMAIQETKVLKDTLNLSERQLSNIRSIQINYYRKVMDIYKHNETADQRFAAKNAIDSFRLKQLNSILNDQQWRKYVAMIKKRERRPSMLNIK